MKLRDAIEIWLNSETNKSFLEWLEEKGLALYGDGFVMVNLRVVDLVKKGVSKK